MHSQELLCLSSFSTADLYSFVTAEKFVVPTQTRNPARKNLSTPTPQQFAAAGPVTSASIVCSLCAELETLRRFLLVLADADAQFLFALLVQLIRSRCQCRGTDKTLEP
jgi:hypothetical protein